MGAITEKFTLDKKEKLANTIIYFAERVNDLSKTKLLKLLYLLEESYIKKYNIPFLDIDYEIWQAGPVNRDVYIELSDEPVILNDYIERKIDEENTFVKAKKGFSDDEFSDNEINEMDIIVKKFGDKTANKLVKITHQKGSAWYYFAEKTGLLPLFENKLKNSSTEKIDFAEYFSFNDDTLKKYQEQKRFNSFVQDLKK